VLKDALERMVKNTERKNLNKSMIKEQAQKHFYPEKIAKVDRICCMESINKDIVDLFSLVVIR
jgi:hypothetical protein